VYLFGLKDSEYDDPAPALLSPPASPVAPRTAAQHHQHQQRLEACWQQQPPKRLLVKLRRLEERNAQIINAVVGDWRIALICILLTRCISNQHCQSFLLNLVFQPPHAPTTSTTTTTAASSCCSGGTANADIDIPQRMAEQQERIMFSHVHDSSR
jgi:hypothetical protein